MNKDQIGYLLGLIIVLIVSHFSNNAINRTELIICYTAIIFLGKLDSKT